MNPTEPSKHQWPFNGEGHIVNIRMSWDVWDLTDDDLDVIAPAFQLWLDKNIKHKYHWRFGGVHMRFNFEDPGDAMHCKLRWVNQVR